MKCEETCLGFKAIGQEACLGCAGTVVKSIRPTLKLELKHTLRPLPILRADGRCVHGLLPGMCSNCIGIPMTKEPYTYHERASQGYIKHLGQAFLELENIIDEEV
jgi:hypothetical protein